MIGVQYHPFARRELDAAARRSERERPGSGARLFREVHGTLARIATAPREGSPYLYGTRRFVLQRFPYSNVYVAMDQEGHVIAIAHFKRRPGTGAGG